ncbi:MAG: hypothetical protein M1140_04685 [Chloroflexi bacterium]|nr:hypothetical protein [Chloroflexota bacterium]
MTQPHALLLAVDGGQTHSLAILAQDDGRVIGAGMGGPANHFLEPGGPERFSASMRDCISAAFLSAGRSLQQVRASHYGLTGVHEQMIGILQQIAPSDCQVIAPDRVASLWGATLRRPAVLVLAGTGAIAYGIDAAGQDAVTGGWGYIMGDEGSAAWIAPRALSAATQALDGRAASTPLTHLIPSYFGAVDLHKLHRLIYSGVIDRVKLAGIARIVGECANTGDAVSMEIMVEAGRHLGNAATAVIRKLHLDSTEVTITSAGGVFKSGRVVIAPMMDCIKSSCPLAAYVPPRFPPVIGALILALQSIGVSADDRLLDNITGSMSMLGALK